MPQVKRARHVFLRLADDTLFDLGALLRGEVARTPRAELRAVSLYAATEVAIDGRDLALLGALPADRWVAAERAAEGAGVPLARLWELAAHGIVVSDRDDPQSTALRRCDEAVGRRAWNAYAALYHFMTRGEARGGEPAELDLHQVAAQSPESFRRFVARHGPPPPAFAAVEGSGEPLPLPAGERQGGLYEVLERRRTSRSFDDERPMGKEALATLLRYAFGCWGTSRLSEDVVALRKTSPSGGSLHPVEVYPLLLRVDGVAPGLFHYDTARHRLSPVCRLELAAARALAVRLAAGQGFVGTAHALFLMTARFYRNFWKYRDRARTYGIVLMDAAHLSQTFYLVATELGLGAFFTAAIDAPAIEAALGVEGAEEGALGISGCGVPHPEDDGTSPAFEPYAPASDGS